MMGRWKVLAPHAELYPNDGAAELVNPAHGARGWPVRGWMLSRAVRGEGQGRWV